MRIIAILGSRNPEGRTTRCADALLEGAATKGAEGEKVFLTEMNVERCRQCDQGGWGTCRTEGACVIEDDFASLVDKLKTSDLAVFANPVYFSDQSESMRAFLDRLRRITRNDAGKEGITEKPAVGICMAGGGGGGAPTCAARMEKVLATCGFDVVDMVPVRRQNLEMKLSVLKTVGEWIGGGEG